MKIAKFEKKVIDIILLCYPTVTVGEAERRLKHIVQCKMRKVNDEH